MSLQQKIDDDLKTALKASDTVKVSVLRMAKAAIKNKEIDKKDTLSEDDMRSVFSTLSKRSKESIEQFAQGGREDLVDKEKQELSILQTYLPQELTQEEIDRIIAEAIRESSAESPRDMGNVMRLVMSRVKGAADGKVVNQRVRALLEKM